MSIKQGLVAKINGRKNAERQINTYLSFPDSNPGFIDYCTSFVAQDYRTMTPWNKGVADTFRDFLMTVGE